MIIVVGFLVLAMWGWVISRQESDKESERIERCTNFLQLLREGKTICAEGHTIVPITSDGKCEKCGANIKDVKPCRHCAEPFHWNGIDSSQLCPKCKLDRKRNPKKYLYIR